MSGGQGTPWSPQQYGMAKAPSLITDPTKMATPGIAEEMAQVRTNAGAQQGSANNAAMAALQRSGVAGGSEMGNVLGNIAGQTAAGTGSALAGLQNQEFGQQAEMANALNQANLSEYGLASQNNLAENQQRMTGASDIGSSAALLAALFGSGALKNNSTGK